MSDLLREARAMLGNWAGVAPGVSALCERIDDFLATPPKSTQPAAFCWLVELFEPGGNSMGHYHTGFTDISGLSRATTDPMQARRYQEEAAAKAAADKLFHLSGVWRAVEHGFHECATQPAPAEGALAMSLPVAPKFWFADDGGSMKALLRREEEWRAFCADAQPLEGGPLYTAAALTAAAEQGRMQERERWEPLDDLYARMVATENTMLWGGSFEREAGAAADLRRIGKELWEATIKALKERADIRNTQDLSGKQ